MYCRELDTHTSAQSRRQHTHNGGFALALITENAVASTLKSAATSGHTQSGPLAKIFPRFSRKMSPGFEREVGTPV